MDERTKVVGTAGKEAICLLSLEPFSDPCQSHEKSSTRASECNGAAAKRQVGTLRTVRSHPRIPQRMRLAADSTLVREEGKGTSMQQGQPRLAGESLGIEWGRDRRVDRGERRPATIQRRKSLPYSRGIFLPPLNSGSSLCEPWRTRKNRQWCTAYVGKDSDCSRRPDKRRRT